MIELEYIWKDDCPVCNIMKPQFYSILRDHPEWKGRETYGPHHLKRLITLGVKVTPTILVYKDGIFMGMIEGSWRKATAISLIKRFTEE